MNCPGYSWYAPINEINIAEFNARNWPARKKKCTKIEIRWVEVPSLISLSIWSTRKLWDRICQRKT